MQGVNANGKRLFTELSDMDRESEQSLPIVTPPGFYLHEFLSDKENLPDIKADRFAWQMWLAMLSQHMAQTYACHFPMKKEIENFYNSINGRDVIPQFDRVVITNLIDELLEIWKL